MSLFMINCQTKLVSEQPRMVKSTVVEDSAVSLKFSVCKQTTFTVDLTNEEWLEDVEGIFYFIIVNR